MKRAVPALLSEMDGIVARKHTLLIIGATNNPWDIDEVTIGIEEEEGGDNES